MALFSSEEFPKASIFINHYYQKIFQLNSMSDVNELLWSRLLALELNAFIISVLNSSYWNLNPLFDKDVVQMIRNGILSKENQIFSPSFEFIID